MCKSIKTKSTYNKEVLEIIQDRFHCSADYVRKCIRGDRAGIVPDQIKSEYNRLNNEVKKAIILQLSKM